MKNLSTLPEKTILLIIIKHLTLYCIILLFLSSCKNNESENKNISFSGNPIFQGWYADPEGVILEDRFWIYPTFSAPFEEQVFMDAFSSEDLVTWTKHERIIDTSLIAWARFALWAPSVIKKEDKYYLFFSANDIQRPGRPGWEEKHKFNDQYGGIGIAVSDSPDGPFKDYLGKPLISEFYNDAQPIDQFVFLDEDSKYYLFYGGWGHCNVGILNEDFTGFDTLKNGNIFKEVTPEGYVEGSFMFKRKGKYYFMWSEGSWGGNSYKVAYAISDSPMGPFNKIGTILETDSTLATGAGHNSVINIPDTDDWIMVYHRRPIPNKSTHHRVVCLDKLEFNSDGTIKPVIMTFKGVEAVKLK